MLCQVEGCRRPRLRQSNGSFYGLCAGHRGRLYRVGDVQADKPLREQGPRGNGTVDPLGYVRERRTGHPIATTRGHVLQHRRVLYDAIGPGLHRCHWCSAEVRWEDKTLEVDHLNGDRSDNRLENLVPSCHPCNASRATAGNPIDWSPAKVA